MNPIKLYLLHFANINKFYDTCVDKKEELASRIPGAATIKNRFILSCLWVAMIIIEPFLSLILITVYLPIFLIKVTTRKRKQVVAKNIALCFSGLARQRIKVVPEVYSKVDYYLYPISVNKIWIMPDREQHSVLEVVNGWEIIKAYFWSCLAVIAATVKTHGKYLYRNYLCFEYLLTYYFLNKLPRESNLYFVNHLDRWAVLFNYAPQENKILLQHGIESPKADWPVKLTKVNKAYVFSENQQERMIKAVLGCKPAFEIMPPTIILTDMPSARERNIVIVAGENYMFYKNEEYIIKKLANENIRIYVKIHPGKNDIQKYIDLRDKQNPNVEIIAIPTFPRVDAVVSHYSTLGIEYEAHNIPVYYYDELTLDDIVSKIKSLKI